MDYRALELKLRKLVERRLEEGWNLRFHGLSWREPGHGCLIGVVDEDPGDFSVRFALDIDDVYTLSRGFELDPFREGSDRELYLMGDRIRRIYCDDNGQVE